MAKSYDKNKDFINDDIIKQALKTGLKSIQPSEELIAKTIDRCSSEISENRVNNKKNKFNPWIYRFSAPIAAGALVLLIVLNYNNLFVRYKSNESTPQSAAHGSDLTLNSSEILAGVDSARSASPEIALDEPSSSVYGLKEDTELKGFAMAEAPYNASNLKSYSVHEENKRTEGTDNSEAFKYIANNFNSEKKTDYVLDVTNIVRANTLVSEGVYADTLLSTEDYRDLLSNEGYWILPLKDNQSVLKALLKVSNISVAEPDLIVSSNDRIYKYNENDYFVSFDESTEIRNLEPMFDKSALSELIKQDNNSVTEPVIVDINHGQDFIVFYEVDGNQKCIPFFTNSGMFGLKNATVYERVRMFRIISQHIQ